MDTQNREPQPHRDKKGQTLAEFALTLPILLLLLFGIIEFGRLFQSWVTLQNAARTAVRYASTGQYKEDRYNIEEMVVCSQDEAALSVGNMTTETYPLGRGMGTIDIDQFAAGSGDDDESFYATWYGQPLGCAPGPETDQNRKDILRLPSIYEEARRGAAGILIENSRVSPTFDSLKDFLYSQFQRPHPDIDKIDWFDVVICSSRNKLYDDINTYIMDLNTLLPITDNDTARFELVLDDAQYAPAACVLREQPTAEGILEDIPANGTKPWMDAGGPGERVTVVITFNHRLITPIGLAEFVKLQAQRSAINESFRVTNAERALGPSGSPADGVPPTPTAPPGSDTPVPSATNTEPPSATPTETDFPTWTPAPFNCDNIDVFFRAVPFSTNRFYFELANFNFEDAYIIESNIVWAKAVVEDDFPDIYLSLMSLNNEVYWSGEDDVSPTYSNSEGTLYYDPTTFDHNVYIPSGGDKVNWQGMFLNGPTNLSTNFRIYDFGGTTFVFHNPDGDDCVVQLVIPEAPPATPTPEDYQTPTPTYTPDCASLTLRVEFVEPLQVAGDVTLRIINSGPVNAPFTGFNIVWPSMSGIGLDRLVFGGRNALDTPEFGGSGIVIWDSPLTGGDTSPPTNSSEATFLPVTIPAFSTTLLHLDFVGVAGRLPISPSDLNGSRFDIWCGTEGTGFGGGGGGGTDDSGRIILEEYNTPEPTSEPPPTWTPLAETYTPTNTPPPALPTNTEVYVPPPNTPVPEDTEIPDTATPVPDIDIGGCGVSGDKC
jgi:hypothetical protein